MNSALLVHGLGRTPISMFPLAGVVRRAGLRTHFFAYSSTFEPFDGIVRRLVGVLDRLRPQVLIAHSLGGLLCRLALAEGGCPDVRRLVMLGTPNRPPRLAAYFWKWWPFRAFAGTSGRFLAHPNEYDRLAVPTVPCTVVAGTAGPVGRLSPFGVEPNDSVVSVGETELPGADHVLVPAWHTWMMAHRDVHAVVLRVLSMCCSGMCDLPPNVNIAYAPRSAARTAF